MVVKNKKKNIKSDFKTTIIVDTFGNNNLNVSSRRIKTNKHLLEVLSRKKKESRDHDLFVDSAEKPKIENIIIFSKKEREEIDKIEICCNEEDETLSLQQSIISFSSNLSDQTVKQSDNLPVPLFSPRELLNKK